MLLTSPNLYIIQAVCFAEKTDTRPILQAVKVWLQLADFRKTNCAFQIRFDKRTIQIFMTFLLSERRVVKNAKNFYPK